MGHQTSLLVHRWLLRGLLLQAGNVAAQKHEMEDIVMCSPYRNHLRALVRRCCVSMMGLALFTISTNAFALLPFEKDKNLYVSMWDADVVKVFTKDGNDLGSMTTHGLDGPRGIAFNPHNGDIWVAGEHSNAIYIFDKKHRFQWTLTHPDFDEPVGISFRMSPGVEPSEQEVYISNSNGNEIMVFDQQGELMRRFTQPTLADPNCSAFMPDGSLFVSNRLGGGSGLQGAVDKYDADDNYLFTFSAPGMVSVMAIARDQNREGDADDTIWVTSGAGDRGIYEFDQEGSLLQSILPNELPDNRITPQGIAFDSNGNFTVASFSTNVIFQFDGDGNFLDSYSAGTGNTRSIAFQYKKPK